MKRITFVFIGLLIAANSLQAFEPSRMHPSDRFIVTLFTDIWQDVPGSMDLKTIQRGINISAMQDMPLGRSNFSVAAGLELSSHNLYSDHRYVYHPHIPGTPEKYDFTPIQDDYNKNKLSLNYLEVPVQFRYRTRELNRTLRFYAGMKAGYLINGHTKYEGEASYPIPGGTQFDILPVELIREVKIKEHKLDNIADYRIGLTAMVGYGSVNLHLYYPLTKIFEENSARDMYPVSLGLSFILF